MVGTLVALTALDHVELTLMTTGGARVMVGVRDATRTSEQPSAHVLARDVALSSASPVARIVASMHAAASFAFERVVVVVADAPCTLAARVVTARATPTETPFTDLHAELRLYRAGLRARTVEPYSAYTARLVDLYDPAATLPQPSVVSSSGSIEASTVYTTAAEASLTLSSSRIGTVPACTSVLLFVSASARLTPRVVGATSVFALDFPSAPTAAPTLLANGAEFPCVALSPGVFSAALPTGTAITIARLVVDGERQHFELVAPMVLTAPAVATKARIVDEPSVAASAYARLRVRLFTVDDAQLSALSVPALVSVTSIGGAVSDAPVTVVSGEVVVTLLEPTRVFAVDIPAGSVCASGAVCGALRASLPLSLGTVFGVCTPARIFGNGTSTVAFAARCTFDTGVSSVGIDEQITSLVFESGFSGTATSITCTSRIAASARRHVASARIASTAAKVYAEVLGTDVALFDASRAVATYADGRVITGRASSLRASNIQSLHVPFVEGVTVISGVTSVTPSTPSGLTLHAGVSCSFAPLALAPAAVYTIQVRDATVSIGEDVVVGVSADVPFGAPRIALVAFGSANSNMGLSTDPSVRVVTFDRSDARFSVPPTTLRTIYVRGETASPVGFVSAKAVLVSTNGGDSFVACADFDSLALFEQQALVRGLAGPYFRRVPLVGGVALLGVFVGNSVAAASVVVAVDGLALESSIGQDARLSTA